MTKREPRPIHNTNSVNYIKLDYWDMCYSLSALESFDDLTEDEKVTVERLKIMKGFMKRKYNQIQEEFKSRKEMK